MRVRSRLAHLALSPLVCSTLIACGSTPERAPATGSVRARPAGQTTLAVTDVDPPADLPELPDYSGGACPVLVSGPTAATSMNVDFPSGGEKRRFRVIVPKSYDGSSDWPVVFAYHWLNSSGGSFVSKGEIETAADEMKFIAVVPERLERDGKKAYVFDWPFVETWGAPNEETFFKDMLACVGGQFRIDTSQVHGIGVSAGALWITYLSTTESAKYFASVISLSGGLGSDPFGVWKMSYKSQPNKFAALVLWGGPTNWLFVDFAAASKRYRDELRGAGHVVVECTHDKGHGLPPIDRPAGGGTRFRFLWQFMIDHPYGTDPSPYAAAGLPPGSPSWCSLTP